MNFADQLRKSAENKYQEDLRKEQEEREALENLRRAIQDERAQYYRDRFSSISSGDAIVSFYSTFKDELTSEAVYCLSDDSKSKCGEFLYQSEEYMRKKADYDTARKKATDYRELNEEYYEFLLPHKVFTKEECDLIEGKLSEFFTNDGLRYQFKREEVYYKHWEFTSEGWHVTTKKFSGYILSFEVNWFPWDSHKQISQKTKNEIHRLCTEFSNNKSVSWVTTNSPKLLKNLGLEGAEIYACQDTTIFRSGREGFAITKDGLYWLTSGTIKSLTFEQFADVKNEDMKRLLPYFGTDEEGLFQQLLNQIQKLIRDELAI